MSRRGLTLVELMVSITLVALMAGLVVLPWTRRRPQVASTAEAAGRAILSGLMVARDSAGQRELFLPDGRVVRRDSLSLGGSHVARR